MVKRGYSIIAALVAVFIIASCAKKPVASTEKKAFEGIIEYKVTYEEGYDNEAAGLPSEVFATFRKGKMMVAMKMGESKMKIISDRDAQSLTSIIYLNKRFTASIGDSNSRKVRSIIDLEIKETEKVKKIAGYRCIKAESQYGVGINAKPFTFYYSPELSNYNYFWHYGFRDVNGILLKFTTYDFGVRAELEAVKVTPKTIDPYIFTFPPGTLIKQQ